MPVRPLLLDADARQRIQHLAQFAADPAHWFTSMRRSLGFIPGQHPEYVVTISSYRCVFTWTEAKTVVVRQLSASVPAPGLLPHVQAVCALATEFGLTGWDIERNNGAPPKDWQWHKGQHSIAVWQVIPPAEVVAAKEPA